MYRSIVIFSDWLDWLTRRLAVLCLTAMLVFVAIQVIARYAFSAPPSWTEEMARYMMVWSGLLGATLSFKSKDDPALFKDPCHDKGSPWWQLTALVRGTAVLIFLVPIIYFSIFGPGMDTTRGFIARQARLSADTLGFPMSWVAMAVPICAAIILVHLLARACELKMAESTRMSRISGQEPRGPR
ncbi:MULTISPECIES: TRAP transporter small permease [Halomonadaceae]|jgi:TRAP-type C4-dicarboxylate transport system permease small subunit|uniref:TRAP transporter small permease protein n=1 Tax=Billgrantia aerodenitrificans TaxID=2733483 RepID=A0ABS9ASC6_9GAMM|nr:MULTISPECIES: TRAP transporter small permease subunit [Halomonas]MCE8024694.1 TRAP transporter small permease subunit [Halomonas aerodenitrificans]MCE8038150.1 TRAP transporter small permease subunit [Halomonas sp. MCCC 1A11062]